MSFVGAIASSVRQVLANYAKEIKLPCLLVGAGMGGGVWCLWMYLGLKKMNKFLNVLPVVIMVESFAAAVPLMVCGRWGSGLYWFSAGWKVCSPELLGRVGRCASG